MGILKVALTSAGSIIVLFFLTKIIGNKQISQLSLFDYINGISIGSIAAEMATSLESDFLKPLIAMIIYALTSLLISVVSNRSIKVRRFLEGSSVILLENGNLYKDNFNKVKMDIHEFLIQCRNQGFFDLSNIEIALLEANGKISFLPKSASRPVNTQDLNLSPSQDKLLTNVIMDGVVMWDHLDFIGQNEKWLMNELKKQGINSIEDVFLATYDSQKVFRVYPIIEQEKDFGRYE